MMYHVNCTFFALYGEMYQVFFNTTHQVKAITIGIYKANPPAEIGQLLQYVHLHVFLP